MDARANASVDVRVDVITLSNKQTDGNLHA